MNYSHILVEENTNKVTVITLNRPKALNALNAELIKELSEALDVLKEKPETRAIVITGSGTKSFVAGADIKEFKNFSAAEGEQLAREGQSMLFDRIANYEKPIIAAVNGFALGGGLELALACHVRYASENAKLGLPEVKLGLIPGYGGTQRLTQLVGKGKAFEMILTAGILEAQEAASCGLVNKVVSSEELLPLCIKVCEAMAKNAPLALKTAISCVNQSMPNEGYEKEIKAFGALFGTSEFKEGVTAFLEKRAPKF